MRFAAILFTLALTGCALDPIERLSEDIDNESAGVRKAAILQLAGMSDDRATALLLDVLQDDIDPLVCTMAGVALVKVGRARGDERPNMLLKRIGFVANDPHLSEHNRARAAWTLGEIGNRQAIPILRAASGGPAVAEQVANALVKLGDASYGLAFEISSGAFTERALAPPGFDEDIRKVATEPMVALPSVAAIEVANEEDEEAAP